MLRLTLRTLLAYLDDTLEANQTKNIGEKVAESELAQQLIERIKKVTRRRGLEAPGIGGDDDSTTDPNTVAEYLDNVLPADQLSEVEEKALESDSRLAEIAACHQILTLVLGEPVRVPPTARQRMYRVVKGRESIPYRKSPPSANVAGVADPDAVHDEAPEDDALLLGLASSKRVLPIAGAAVLMVLLGIAVWLALPAAPIPGRQGYIFVAANSTTPDKNPTKIIPPAEVKKPRIDESKKIDSEPPKKVVPEAVKPAPEVGPDPRIVVEEPKPKEKIAPAESIAKPDPDRRELAHLSSRDTVVMQRPRDTDRWIPVDPAKAIFSADTLMSLPGYRSDVLLDTGVQLRLWGSLPDFSISPLLDLLESRVVLHVPPKDFDADFTLESGRVFITRPVVRGQEAKPAKVRLRFKEEVWDITLLDADTEVAVDLLGIYPEGVPFSKEPGGESPLAEFNLGILKGKAGVHIGFKDFPMLPAPTRIDWDNKGAGVSDPVQVPPKGLLWWSTELPANPQAKEAIKELQAALAELARRLNKDGALAEVVFASALKDDSKNLGPKILAIFCLQAMDDIETLAAMLGDDFYFLRAVAVRATLHWTAQSAERDLQFYKMLMEKKGYTETQARTVMQLLHTFSPKDAQSPETFAALFDYLKHEKTAVRELAIMRLAQMDQEGAKEFALAYVKSTEDRRDNVVEQWKASWKRRSEKK